MKVKNIVPIILAAGKGTRMGTKRHKSLLSICGKPLISWIIETLKKVGFRKIIIVVRSDDRSIEKTFSKEKQIIFTKDPFSLGAGHSLFTGMTAISQMGKEVGSVLVLYGDDSFLYTPKTIKNFIHSYQRGKQPIWIMTVKKPLVSSIGGLKRDKNGCPCGFYTKSELEKRGATEIEIVCGTFLFNLTWLKNHFHKMTRGQNGEFLLTSLIRVAWEERNPCGVYQLANPNEWWGVNTKKDLKKARELKRRQINARTL